jgi:hypothetical protein
MTLKYMIHTIGGEEPIKFYHHPNFAFLYAEQTWKNWKQQYLKEKVKAPSRGLP